MELTPAMATCIAMAIAAVFLLHHLLSRRRRKLNLPPGPRPWPVIGNLDVLAGALPPHRSLAALAARYGSLMYLRLGSFPTIVATSADTARLILKTHDLAFVDRPRTIAGMHTAYNYSGIVHTPYGPYWRMARKLCATELFGVRRVDSYEHIRTQEIRALMHVLFNSCGRPVVIKDHLTDTTLRNILRMTLGERWSESYRSTDGEEFRRSLEEAFALTGSIKNVGNWIPWLGLLDLQGSTRRMKKLAKLYDRFLESILDEHEERRRQRQQRGDEPEETSDMVDVLLQLMGKPGMEAQLKREGVKALILDIIAGGTESSAVTMEWAMAELLRRSEVLSAATDELDRVVGRGRWVTECDMVNLPYIDAIMKETLRMHPIGPLLVPHLARENVTMAGYDVPAGTRVLVNVWAIARDPASWPDRPEEFRPERFVGSSVDVRGMHFELLPFGAGRRICPAYNLALRVVGTGIANLLHGFTWRLPDGVKPEDVSMEEAFGLSTCRKSALVAVAEPRLPAHLYAA